MLKFMGRTKDGRQTVGEEQVSHGEEEMEEFGGERDTDKG